MKVTDHRCLVRNKLAYIRACILVRVDDETGAVKRVYRRGLWGSGDVSLVDSSSIGPTTDCITTSHIPHFASMMNASVEMEAINVNPYHHRSGKLSGDQFCQEPCSDTVWEFRPLMMLRLSKVDASTEQTVR